MEQGIVRIAVDKYRRCFVIYHPDTGECTLAESISVDGVRFVHEPGAKPAGFYAETSTVGLSYVPREE